MSQVRRGDASIDDTPQTIVDYPAGGTFRAHIGAGSIGAQVLTLSAYTRAHQGAEEVLAKSVSLTGPTSTGDQDVLRLEITTTQPVRFDVVLDTGTLDAPYWVESVGQVATIEDGENTTTADGSEQTVASSLYAGNFMWLVDVSAMQAGDDVTLRLKTLKSGGYFVEEKVDLSDVQADGIYEVGPIVAPEAARVSLEQTGGVNRSYPSSLVRC